MTRRRARARTAWVWSFPSARWDPAAKRWYAPRPMRLRYMTATDVEVREIVLGTPGVRELVAA